MDTEHDKKHKGKDRPKDKEKEKDKEKDKKGTLISFKSLQKSLITLLFTR